MTSASYHFDVGQIKCVVLQDGVGTYPDPARFFFANAPQTDLERVLRDSGIDPKGWTAWVTPFPSLLIDTAHEKVLIDTGAGQASPTTGMLISRLQAEGIHPDHIDVVVLTHGHPDHIGGTVDSEGTPAFRNARYVMWKEEWEFWTADEPDLSQVDWEEPLGQHLVTAAHDNLLPIEAHVDLVDTETEIVAGIQPIAAPGHTPGHMAVSISSHGERLLYLSDTVLHPIHVQRPEWLCVVELEPEQTVRTRRRLLARATAEKTLVHAFHFPFPGLGHIIDEGDRWQWQPVEMTDSR